MYLQTNKKHRYAIVNFASLPKTFFIRNDKLFMSMLKVRVIHKLTKTQLLIKTFGTL